MTFNEWLAKHAELPNSAEIQRSKAAWDHQQAIIDKLQAKIKAHNDECVELCDEKKRCGFEAYKTDCGNCTKDWMIGD